MNNTKIKVLGLLGLINLSSCSTRKLNSQKLAGSALQKSEIRMQELKNETYAGSRQILLTDSANELYSVSIFPADTFSFSALHGFRGKAAKIEISGLMQRVITRSDSADLRTETQSGLRYEEQQESKKSEISRAKVLEMSRWHPLLIIIILVAFLAIGWLLFRRPAS